MRSIRQIFSIVLAILFAGCQEHKDILCPGEREGKVDVRFDWEKAPGADPEGMTVYFFPLSHGGRIWRFDIPGSKGGEVRLPSGEYQMLAYNNDLRSVRFADTSAFLDFRGDALKAGSGGFLAPVGVLYGAECAYVEVTPCGVKYGGGSGDVKECPFGVVRCYPDSLTTVFNVRVRNVRGIERVRATQGYLDGVGSCVTLSDSRVGGIPTAVTFPMHGSAAANEISGVAGAFADTGYGGKFTVTLVVTRTDGEKIAKQFDVTAQVLNSRPARNVNIVIDGLDIPEGEVPGEPDIGGIQVGVDGWTTYEITLDTGGIIRI